jgi:hypothetical protein
MITAEQSVLHISLTLSRSTRSKRATTSSSIADPRCCCCELRPSRGDDPLSTGDTLVTPLLGVVAVPIVGVLSGGRAGSSVASIAFVVSAVLIAIEGRRTTMHHIMSKRLIHSTIGKHVVHPC